MFTHMGCHRASMFLQAYPVTSVNRFITENVGHGFSLSTVLYVGCKYAALEMTHIVDFIQIVILANLAVVIKEL